ncbi:MAG: hypothetical protein BWY95_00422 [Bacteroidetes bacterium ADurb.BinA104]|nr:MAG: hypothetical protein BWY95_00422 [Bacteroidetes bacterium ADurb.BinA104]
MVQTHRRSEVSGTGIPGGIGIEVWIIQGYVGQIGNLSRIHINAESRCSIVLSAGYCCNSIAGFAIKSSKSVKIGISTLVFMAFVIGMRTIGNMSNRSIGSYVVHEDLDGCAFTHIAQSVGGDYLQPGRTSIVQQGFNRTTGSIPVFELGIMGGIGKSVECQIAINGVVEGAVVAAPLKYYVINIGNVAGNLEEVVAAPGDIRCVFSYCYSGCEIVQPDGAVHRVLKHSRIGGCEFDEEFIAEVVRIIPGRHIEAIRHKDGNSVVHHLRSNCNGADGRIIRLQGGVIGNVHCADSTCNVVGNASLEGY